MTVRQPVRISRRVEHESFGGHRLERIFGYAPTSPQPISTLVDDLDACAIDGGHISHVAAYIDASFQTPAYVSEGTTVVHVLWTAPRTRAEMFAGLDPCIETELMGYEVYPGDTATIPKRVPYALRAGIVAFAFGSARSQPTTDPAAVSRSPLPQPPNHGLDLFDRFNRRTICAAHEGLLLERWKISLPLDLSLKPDRWHYLTNLVAPVALNWPGGSMLLKRTESRFLPRGLDRITIVPDGLGYVLIGSIPNLMPDVVIPLRRAGYDRSAIASLGVPPGLLE